MTSLLLYVQFVLLTLLFDVAITESKFSLHASSWRLDSFQEAFGCCPRICRIIWRMCRLGDIPGIQVKHLLWGLCFLKVYTTQNVLKAMVGNPAKKMFKRWVWVVVDAIANASERIIRFNNRFKSDKGRTCKITVDCTDCAISEPWPWESSFNKQFFSQKINGAALKYEVGVGIQTGDIVWVNGPFKAGKWNDITVYRRDLKGALASSGMVEADRGYRVDETIRCPDTVLSRRDKAAKSKAMQGTRR